MLCDVQLRQRCDRQLLALLATKANDFRDYCDYYTCLYRYSFSVDMYVVGLSVAAVHCMRTFEALPMPVVTECQPQSQRSWNDRSCNFCILF